jgi:hypothetical protein
VGKYFVPAIVVSIAAGLILSTALVYYQQYLEGIGYDEPCYNGRCGYTTALAGYNYQLFGIIGGLLAAVGIALFVTDLRPKKILQ